MEISTKSSKSRSANMDLLRILAMLTIICYHITTHGVLVQITTGEYFHHPVVYGKLFIITVIRTFGLVSNNIFLLISGYFMVNRVKMQGNPIDLKKTSKKLVLQVVFSAVLLVLVSSVARIVMGAKITAHGISVFNTMSWYVGYYLAVITVAALFLNNFLFSLDKNRHAAFILVLFACVSFTWTNQVLSAISDGLPIFLLGVLLYSVGGYVRRFNPFENVRTYVPVVIIALVYVFVCISQYTTTVTDIDNFLMGDTSKPFFQPINYPMPCDAVPFVLSVCVFELFRRVHIPNSKLITFLSSATFMIYLFHDNEFFTASGCCTIGWRRCTTLRCYSYCSL